MGIDKVVALVGHYYVCTKNAVPPFVWKVGMSTLLLGAAYVAAQFFGYLWAPAWAPGQESAFIALNEKIASGAVVTAADEAVFNNILATAFNHSPLLQITKVVGCVATGIGTIVGLGTIWTVQVQ